MRVVIDPSVYISAALSPSGAPAQLIRRWRLRQFDMILSAKLLGELDRTLRRDRFRSYIGLDDVAALIDELRRRGELANDPEHPASISRDPHDDYLIALALGADAAALVSGDRDLTDLAIRRCASSRPGPCSTSSPPPPGQRIDCDRGGGGRSTRIERGHDCAVNRGGRIH